MNRMQTVVGVFAGIAFGAAMTMFAARGDKPPVIVATTVQDSGILNPESPMVVLLAGLRVEPEHPRTGYDRGLFGDWEGPSSCNTRCQVLDDEQRDDGTWLSVWDGEVTSDPRDLHIDHIVAVAEAWDSGADGWDSATRGEFYDWRANLIAVTAASNLRKSDRDAAEWFPSRPEAVCLFAHRTIVTKAHWDLSVDSAEHGALVNMLDICEVDR